MYCKDFEALLDQYLAGTLSQQERTDAEEHLRSCPGCRLRLKVLEDCRNLHEDDEVPVAFSSAWRQRINEEEADTMPVKRHKLTRWLAIAAALVFVVGGTYLAGQNRRVNLEPTAQTQSNLDLARGAESYAGIGPMSAPISEAGAAFGAKAADSAEVGEKIIRTVQLEMSTRSFDTDYEAIRQALEKTGGRVESANLYTDYNDLRTAYLTMRVPGNQLNLLTEAVKGIGRLVNFSESSEDVSESYTDTENRLATQQTKMERLQALLAKAETVEDLIAIETSISDTQYEIDRLTGQLRGMDSKVDFSTLTLTLTELSDIQTSQQKNETLWERIKIGMKAAWESFLTILGDLAVFLTVVLPYLIALAVIILILRVIIKRRKK
jgi:hypothetical protein